jgi:hypothetical protein
VQKLQKEVDRLEGKRVVFISSLPVRIKCPPWNIGHSHVGN